MIRAVVFDLYGVLALNGWQAFKAKHFTARQEIWNEVFELSKQVDVGLVGYDDLIAFTAEQTGESQATVRHQLEHTEANDELLAYIASALKPQYRLGILSNAGSDKVLNIFTPEQNRLFDVVLLSYHAGFVKPQADFFQLLTENLGIEPGECVLVDDQERHLAGARDAGMHTILYQDFEPFRGDLENLLSQSEA